MRVCIAVPSISDFYFSINRMSALGARTVLYITEKAGHDAVLADFPRLVRRARRIPIHNALSHLKPYLIEETGPASFFTTYKRLGPDPAECARTIAKIEPDLLLISCFAYAYAEDTLSLARAVHACIPRLSIAVGGAGATALPERFLRSEAISFVLTGEAEVNLGDFLHEFVKSDPDYDAVRGLWSKKSGDLIAASPPRETTAEELQWIHAISPELSGGQRLTAALSRGCPKRCAFCSNYLCHGRTFRKVPIERVTRGIDSAARAITSRPAETRWRLNLEDDNIFADREYARAVIEYAADRLNSPTIVAENGIDSSFLNSSLLEKLIDTGLEQLNLSLGSVDAQVLSYAHRNETTKKIEELTQQAAARGVGSTTYFICGLPGDTGQTVVGNLLFLASLKTRIGISLFYPTPGIEGFTDKKMFLDASPVLCCASSAYPWTDTLTTRSLVTAFRLARFINLLKDPRKAEPHTDLINQTIAKRKLHTWQKSGPNTKLVEVPNTDRDLAEEVISQLN